MRQHQIIDWLLHPQPHPVAEMQRYNRIAEQTLGGLTQGSNADLFFTHAVFQQCRNPALAQLEANQSLGATLLPGSLKQLVVFALFVLVLLFRPAGLFGGGRGR
jgi:branched-subunit amino acid ABC-type transport system permease component